MSTKIYCILCMNVFCWAVIYTKTIVKYNHVFGWFCTKLPNLCEHAMIPFSSFLHFLCTNDMKLHIFQLCIKLHFRRKESAKNDLILTKGACPAKFLPNLYLTFLYRIAALQICNRMTKVYFLKNELRIIAYAKICRKFPRFPLLWSNEHGRTEVYT